jgi:chemotaxis protein MotB
MRALAFAVIGLAAACGVPKETYLAKEMEADKYRKLYEQESEKTADFTRKIGDMGTRVTILEEDSKQLSDRFRAAEASLEAKQADLRAAQERTAELQALVGLLAKTELQLSQAKAELERKSAEYDRVTSSLREEIEAGQIQVSELRGRMTIKLADRVLFASGSAVLDKDGRAALGKVADALRAAHGRLVRVEGHTDNVSVQPGGPFPSNWELSTARALAVVRFLQDAGVDPTLLAATGYGEYQPVAANDTVEGRSQNRRIEIVLAAAEGAQTQAAPVKAPSAARKGKKPAKKSR